MRASYPISAPVNKTTTNVSEDFDRSLVEDIYIKIETPNSGWIRVCPITGIVVNDT